MSKKAGYRSRASLKLKEILQKGLSVKKGMSVIDLGSFPGGWTQVVKEKVGEKGTVIGVDIQNIKEIEGTFFINKSISQLEDKDFKEFKEKIPFDLVLSDMAPRISGIGPTDEAAHSRLVDSALQFCSTFLGRKGTLVIKIFENGDVRSELDKIRDNFASIIRQKPKASRADSSEFYVVARGYAV